MELIFSILLLALPVIAIWLLLALFAQAVKGRKKMAASMQELKSWYDRGVSLGATHMIVKMDWFDYEDYPVYVMPGQSARTVAHLNKDRTMECYSMNISWDIQSREFRAQHWED